MKAVKDYLELGLAFVDGDKICRVTGYSSSGEMDIFDRTICAKKYSKGAAKIGIDCYARARWTPSSFAWRNNDGVKPEYNGLIHAMFENGVIIQDFADSLNWVSSFNPIIQWRPVVSMCNHTELKPRHSFVTAISIDGPKFWNKSMPSFSFPCAAVNIKAVKTTVSPKEDKPMNPVYTAEMHAKGELPPVGAECILTVYGDPRPAKVTYIGKDIVCCSNVDGDAEYACLLGSVSFKPIPKTIKVNCFDVPAPMSKEPEHRQVVYLAHAAHLDFNLDFTWQRDDTSVSWLSRGLVHSTESAAIAHAKAMLGIDPNA